MKLFAKGGQAKPVEIYLSGVIQMQVLKNSKKELREGSKIFVDFYKTYYNSIKSSFDKFDSLWAKWRSEDLIPFLSDFDSRLICRQPVSPEEWIELDEITGRLQLEFVEKHPEWMRILEHTPGITLTREEMLDPHLFQPETQFWSMYEGDFAFAEQVEEHNRKHRWDSRHEYYFLKKFFYYYGPYLRDIDPPINVPGYESKYKLHSRLWHYFVPASQAALSMVERQTIRGKFETLRGWLKHFPKHPTLKKTLDIMENHYECDELEDEQKLCSFDREMFEFFKEILNLIKSSSEIIDFKHTGSVDSYKKQLSQISIDPMMIVFDGVRFSRIRKGRYYFYLNSPEHFASDILIGREIPWLKSYFTKPFFEAYLRVIRNTKRSLTSEEIFEELETGLLNPDELQTVKTIFEYTYKPEKYGGKTEAIRKAMEIYAQYHLILEKLLLRARKSVQKQN